MEAVIPENVCILLGIDCSSFSKQLLYTRKNPYCPPFRSSQTSGTVKQSVSMFAPLFPTCFLSGL